LLVHESYENDGIDANIMESDTFSLDFSISSMRKGRNIINRKLIPIDHGLSIPDTLNVFSYDLVWLSFDQAELPFSSASLQYIRNIDILNDIKTL
jgi:hypothetical protein